MPSRFARVKVPPKPKDWLRYKKDRIPFCSNCFTPAELKTIYALLKAPAIKDMMRELKWSDKTVKFYRVLICRKFGVANVDELLVLWLRLDTTRYIHSIHGEHRKTRPNRNCLQVPRKEQRAQRREYNRQYYLAHRAKFQEKSRKWRETNPEAYKEQMQRSNKKRSIRRNEEKKPSVDHLNNVVDIAMHSARSIEQQQRSQAQSEVTP